MPTDSSFKRLAIQSRKNLRVWVEGRPVEVMEGDSAAAVMLAQGELPTRTTAVSATPRAPYCMMGVCFECLMEIDGVANSQGCMTPVREGMRINRQQGAKTLKETSALDKNSTSNKSSKNNTLNNNDILNEANGQDTAIEPKRTVVEDTL
ncbi:(2Fe-2S)-binding protein [Motiliproteus sp. MSK22-1]|uniref:(2Fe-2S)-binding protein n=1 Tax=Motiliproteus sp. MSK22-1 TaxID=1897630 RepID=UPI000978784D|nr:(2Fe-2S)-binding protein [Motiliproteus sp. MSK22-1]OMH39248.1 hypothetical protein BGP75_03900 [Motiliproteus sp. MSK22-1]